MNTAEKSPRRFLLGLILGGIHAVLFILVAFLVAFSSDGEAAMAYYIFFWLDYPISRVFAIASAGSGLGIIFFLGGLLWFAYGWIVQGVISIRSQYGVRWLAGSLSFLVALLLLPELALRSLSDWEEQWERGTAAAEAGEITKAIMHVSDAIELSPPDNPLLDGMWDYLGRLQVDAKNYDEAEQSFKAALADVQSRSSSRPIDHLNAHNQLSWFYNRIEDAENEKNHLRKAIEYNRLVYEGDSTQEANCWQRLAEMDFKSGKTREAIRILDRAITMEADLEHTNEWSLNYMKDQRKEWIATTAEND
ncbi:MAG: tetratricopeptide repeat protein [Verrucomicrobiota bacterium]